MDLLAEIEQTCRKAPDIKGLLLHENFITEEEERRLVNYIDTSEWISDLKRRVQHYGYRYDYKARSSKADNYLGPLPTWVDALCNRLIKRAIFLNKPDQAIVNEYLPGQGISAHVDCVPCFGPELASLSLLSSVVMKFAQVKNKSITHEIMLPPRSIIVMTDDARYKWTHEIAPRKNDPTLHGNQSRSRRVSITFRNMIF